MIYIENNLEKQDLFIPRNDGQSCYVSPYDKGYQDGYEDGLEDCGAGCTLQEKEVTVTATTQVVRPDSGYVGMDAVSINASQFVLEKYNEGYHDGEEDGKQEQKNKLVSTAFTHNGIFTREDGWNEVEVSVGDIPCVLEEKSAIVTANTQTVLPSSGYEGMSAVEIDATDFGYTQYISGWGDGINSQKSKLSGDTFTENGDYLRADGWSAVTVDVRPQLETKNIVLTAATECITKTPDTTYIGFAVPEWARENGINTGIKTDSATTIRVKYIGRGQQSDRVAGIIQYFDRASWDWRFFDAPGMDKTRYYRCGSKTINDSTTGQSFTEAGVLYDYTMEKDTLYDNINGVVVFELTGATIPTNYNIWVDVGSIWLEELTIEKGEGVVFHGTAYDDGEGTIGLYDSVSDSVFTLYSGSSGTLVTYTAVYDGIGEVCVDATNICQTYYSEGYQDGQAECPPCPEPEIESAVTYGIGRGFTGATITPSSGYDGMAEVTITDNGYGQEKYDEGYGDGFLSGQTDILSGMSSTAFTHNDTYTNPNGWSGVTVAVQPTLEAASYALPTGFTGTTIVPSSGYDGLSSVVITDNGYGQEKYDEGYSDGQASCPQPTLEQKSVVMSATNQTFYPSSGYDGMDEIAVDASSLCNDFYQDGYIDGSNDATDLGQEIIIASSVTITEYGKYYFVYDSATSVTAMTVYFQNQSPTPPTPPTGLTGNVITYVSDRNQVELNGTYSNNGNLVNSGCNVYDSYDNKLNLVSNTYSNGVGYLTFDGNVDRVGKLWYNNPHIIEINFPNGMRQFKDMVAEYCGLTALTIPSTVEAVGASSFLGNNITEIVFPDSCYFIGYDAFRYNPLTAITFGTGMTGNIGECAFMPCTISVCAHPEWDNTRDSLKVIYAHMTTTVSDLRIPPYNYGPFYLRTGGGTLYVPQGHAADYQGWLNALPSGWTISDTL